MKMKMKKVLKNLVNRHPEIFLALDEKMMHYKK